MADLREEKLIRFIPNGMTADGTFGRFRQWATMEDDWLDNRPRVSCIPPDRYLCVRSFYHKGGYECFEITEVPGRSLIKIHAANVEEHVEGCVGLGLKVGQLVVKDEDTGVRRSKIAVLSSRKAHAEFMAEFKGVDKFWLTIENYRF